MSKLNSLGLCDEAGIISMDFSKLEDRVLDHFSQSHQTQANMYAMMQGLPLRPTVIDSMTALGKTLHQELEPGTKNMRMFVVMDNVVTFSHSGIYATALRQRISNMHKTNPRAKYYLLTRSNNSWMVYRGKKPFNNSIVDRFKPVTPQQVPAVIRAYALICPEDE